MTCLLRTSVAALCWVSISAYGADSAPQSKPDLKFDGRVSLQLESRDQFAYSDFAKDAQLDLETKRKGGFRAELDVKAGTGSGVALREVFLDYKSESGNRFILGQAKKRFGLEGELDLEERLTLGDSLVYRKLSALSYVGRDSTVEYRRGDLDDRRMSHDLSLHSSEGLNGSALHRLRLRMGEESQLSTYSLLQMDAMTEWRVSGAFGVSYALRNETQRLETEVFAGEDFIESDFQFQRGAVRDVYFGAMTLGYAHRFGSMEPFLRSSLLLNDLGSAGNRSVEGVLGARYHMTESFQLGSELNLSHSTIFSSASQVVFAARYFF